MTYPSGSWFNRGLSRKEALMYQGQHTAILAAVRGNGEPSEPSPTIPAAYYGPEFVARLNFVRWLIAQGRLGSYA